MASATGSENVSISITNSVADATFSEQKQMPLRDITSQVVKLHESENLQSDHQELMNELCYDQVVHKE